MSRLLCLDEEPRKAAVWVPSEDGPRRFGAVLLFAVVWEGLQGAEGKGQVGEEGQTRACICRFVGKMPKDPQQQNPVINK